MSDRPLEAPPSLEGEELAGPAILQAEEEHFQTFSPSLHNTGDEWDKLSRRDASSRASSPSASNRSSVEWEMLSPGHNKDSDGSPRAHSPAEVQQQLLDAVNNRLGTASQTGVSAASLTAGSHPQLPTSLQSSAEYVSATEDAGQHELRTLQHKAGAQDGDAGSETLAVPPPEGQPVENAAAAGRAAEILVGQAGVLDTHISVDSVSAVAEDADSEAPGLLSEEEQPLVPLVASGHDEPDDMEAEPEDDISNPPGLCSEDEEHMPAAINASASAGDDMPSGMSVHDTDEQPMEDVVGPYTPEGIREAQETVMPTADHEDEEGLAGQAESEALQAAAAAAAAASDLAQPPNMPVSTSHQPSSPHTQRSVTASPFSGLTDDMGMSIHSFSDGSLVSYTDGMATDDEHEHEPQPDIGVVSIVTGYPVGTPLGHSVHPSPMPSHQASETQPEHDSTTDDFVLQEYPSGGEEHSSDESAVDARADMLIEAAGSGALLAPVDNEGAQDNGQDTSEGPAEEGAQPDSATPRDEGLMAALKDLVFNKVLSAEEAVHPAIQRFCSFLKEWTSALYSNIAVPLGAIGMGAKSPIGAYASHANQAVKSYGYDWLHLGLASGLTVMGALLVYYKIKERSLVNTMRAKDRMVAKYIMQVFSLQDALQSRPVPVIRHTSMTQSHAMAFNICQMV